MCTNAASLKFEIKKYGLLSASMHFSLGGRAKSSTRSQPDWDQGEQHSELTIDLRLGGVGPIRYSISQAFLKAKFTSARHLSNSAGGAASIENVTVSDKWTVRFVLSQI